MKLSDKILAIKLRRRGLSYAEILKLVPVAKSTLSLWLRSVHLTRRQQQRLTKKKTSSALRGAERRRELRILKTKEILKSSSRDIGSLSKRELFLIGAALYWAEGSKEKEHRPGSGVQFTNSDAKMIKLFLKWLTRTIGIERGRVYFDIYIHENCRRRAERIIQYWIAVTKFHDKNLYHVYFKRNKINTLRKNKDGLYYGTLKIRVKASSELNRKISGWINGLTQNY